ATRTLLRDGSGCAVAGLPRRDLLDSLPAGLRRSHRAAGRPRRRSRYRDDQLMRRRDRDRSECRHLLGASNAWNASTASVPPPPSDAVTAGSDGTASVPRGATVTDL